MGLNRQTKCFFIQNHNIFVNKKFLLMSNIDNKKAFSYNKSRRIKMVILSAIWKFICGIFKFVWKAFWFIIKGFLTPFGLLLRLILIGAIIVGIIIIF